MNVLVGSDGGGVFLSPPTYLPKGVCYAFAINRTLPKLLMSFADKFAFCVNAAGSDWRVSESIALDGELS